VGHLASLKQSGGWGIPSIQTITFNPASQVNLLVQQSDAYIWTGRPPTLPTRAYDGMTRAAARGFGDSRRRRCHGSKGPRARH
jgi:hypothetical protein